MDAADPGRDPRRAACDEQARRLLSPEGQATATLLDLAGAGGTAAPSERAAAEIAGEIVARYLGDTPAPIGIWTPDTRDGQLVFVRDAAAVTRDW